MGMYNMILGHSYFAGAILAVLGMEPKSFGRFRDAYMQDGLMVVFTRCGGGNRDDYENVFEMARQHPLFVDAVDDDYDSTYCSFRFRLPKQGQDELRPAGEIPITDEMRWEFVSSLAGCPSMPPLRDRWIEALDAIKKPDKEG